MDYGWAERGCSIVDSYRDDSAFNGGAGRAPVGEGQLIEERRLRLLRVPAQLCPVKKSLSFQVKLETCLFLKLCNCLCSCHASPSSGFH